MYVEGTPFTIIHSQISNFIIYQTRELHTNSSKFSKLKIHKEWKKVESQGNSFSISFSLNTKNKTRYRLHILIFGAIFQNGQG